MPESDKKLLTKKESVLYYVYKWFHHRSFDILYMMEFLSPSTKKCSKEYFFVQRGWDFFEIICTSDEWWLITAFSTELGGVGIVKDRLYIPIFSITFCIMKEKYECSFVIWSRNMKIYQPRKILYIRMDFLEIGEGKHKCRMRELSKDDFREKNKVKNSHQEHHVLKIHIPEQKYTWQI